MAKSRDGGPVRRHGNSECKRIVVVVVPPIEELDFVGPLQVFSSVNRLAHRPIYCVEVVTNAEELKVRGEGGLLTFLAQGHFRDLEGRIDSVLLVCGVGTRNARDAGLFAWLREIQPRVRRLGAVCVGAFLFAAAGLLKGKRATAHWKFGQELASRYPDVKVEYERLWSQDGNIYTSAGISAGIDLALAWAEEDCGSALAHEAARELVLFLRRPAGQPQLSVSLASQASQMKSLQELQVWIADNLHRKISIQQLAHRVSMSVRNFERVFLREIGRTPAQYLLQARVEATRFQLEKTDRGMKQIADGCGFGSADRMHRAFVRALGVTPGQYRRRLERMGKPVAPDHNI